MPTAATIIGFLKDFAPLDLAADWDNVGLLLGDDRIEVSKLMTCLTVTPESAAEAIDAGAQMIVTHHPIMFRPIQRLTAGDFTWRLARAGVAVYSPHTAFDNCNGGINDILARRLALQDIRPLRPRNEPGQCKIVVFLPESDFDAVSEALFDASAGHIGDYSECSYRVTGTGTFHGSDETNPTIGQKGRREETTEWRLEVICPAAKVPQALTAMIAAHSYEEPAYDVYSLHPTPSRQGEGRLGELPQPMSLADLAQKTKDQLKASCVQTVGTADKPIKRVAIACGAAGEFLRDAVKAKADAFLTGEMRFHDYLTAREKDVALILPGHYASERPAVEELASMLNEKWPDVEVWASRVERDPLKSV